MKTTQHIEPLEPRIAPATITINAAMKTATWMDWDGDLVTLKYSSAQAPSFAKTDSGMGLIVDKLTLNKTDHSNAAFSLTVKAANGGDGRIDLGRIDADNVPLKSWSSPCATIAEVDIGDGSVGIGTFLSATLGAVPYTKFNNTGGDGESDVFGNTGTFTVRGDIASTSLTIQCSKVGAFTVTGSLRGDSPVAGIMNGHVTMNVGATGSVFIGGGIVGGDEYGEGAFSLNNGPVGKFTLIGNVVGGSENYTGSLGLDGARTAVIRGDIVGGTHDHAGNAYLGDCGSITVGGSVLGGTSSDTGKLAVGSANSLAIKGSVVGGFMTDSTDNYACGAVEVSGDLKTFFLGGDLIGGTYGKNKMLSYNGAVLVEGNIGTATIKGSIIGHNEYAAIFMAGGVAPAKAGNYNAIGKLTVGGSVSYGYIGTGQTASSGFFEDRIGAAENPDAGIGSVTVGGDWFHSSLTAGINDISSNGVNSIDTHDLGDPARQAVIGPIAIKGFALDNPKATGYSGFAAEKIASITAHGVKLFTSGQGPKTLDLQGYVLVKEL